MAQHHLAAPKAATRHLRNPVGAECAFCRRNREPPQVFRSHQLKDPSGKVTCPQLYRYRCELCGATGEEAHTRSYCPSAQRLHQQMRQQSSVPSLRRPASSTGRQKEPGEGSQEEPGQHQSSGFSISLGSDRMFRNMGLVTSTRFNSAGRLRYPPQHRLASHQHQFRRDQD